MAGRPRSTSVLSEIRECLEADHCSSMVSIDRYMAIPEYALNDEGLSAINMCMDNWRVRLFWVAYESHPSIDIKRSPYLTPYIRSQRFIGATLWHWQRLVKGCWEDSDQFSDKYQGSNPLAVWAAAMCEQKLCALMDASTVQNKGVRLITNYRLAMETYVRELMIGVAQYSDKRNTPITNHIIKTAFNLSKKRGKGGCRHFKTKYWEPFLTSLREQIEHPPWDHANPAVLTQDGLVQVRGRLRPIATNHPQFTGPPQQTIEIRRNSGEVVTLALYRNRFEDQPVYYVRE